MYEIDKILDEKEKVLWEGKPKFLPFFLGGSIPLFIVGLIFLAVGLLAVIIGVKRGQTTFLLLPHFWIGVLIVFGIPIYNVLVFGRMHYAITNKRVIIQKGLVGRDFEMVDFDQISNAEVRVGVIDKIFGGGSGSILVSTAGTFTYGRHGPIQRPYTIRNIDNPYEVFKFFKKVSHDVKTDINYPNKYRPDSNPGYNTEYKPKKK